MDKREIISSVQNISSELEVGESFRGICPECLGGSSEEQSFSVKRISPTLASFICYRATCNLGSGRVAVYEQDGKIFRSTSKAVSHNRRIPDLYPLSEDAVELLQNKYGWSKLQMRYAAVRLTEDKRLGFPIKSINNVTKGYEIRKEKELYRGKREYGSIPKSWKFINDNERAQASWYRHQRHTKKNSDTLVIVEDILSAVRLTPYCDSAALLGTNLLRPVIADIRSQGYETVWLALDQDATKKAFSLVRRLQPELPNMSVMYLAKDIKNMDETELEELMRSYGVH